MSTTLTSPHNLRDTQLLRTISEMREADRLSAIAAEQVYEPDGNLRVCRTCSRFVGLDKGDRDTLRRLHLRSDDICAVMEGAGICTGDDDDDDRAPSLVLAEDGTCGEWEPCA